MGVEIPPIDVQISHVDVQIHPIGVKISQTAVQIHPVLVQFDQIPPLGEAPSVQVWYLSMVRKTRKGHPLPDAPICIAAAKMLPNPCSISRCYVERIGRLYVECLIECVDVEHGAVYAGNGRGVNVLL